MADNDWIEACNRNGVVVCRAVVSHRIPEGTVFIHHAMDRHLNVLRTETSGLPGGGDNSLTRGAPGTPAAQGRSPARSGPIGP